MTEFAIVFDWEDPMDARGPELRATWARLGITVHGRCVTRVFDERSRSVRDAVYVPLYPLAEWLVTQWWSLWNEPNPAQPADRPGYESRHSLVSAREGYALPPLRIVPAGSTVMLAWTQAHLPAHHLEFIGCGAGWVGTRLAKELISSLIDAVVSRLEEQHIEGTLLQQDWEAIRSADSDERDFCRCVGSLGLDPYALDDSQQKEILDAADRIPEEVKAEFFTAARRTELVAEAEELSDAFTHTRSNTSDLAPLKELRHVTRQWMPPSVAMPHEQGYAFAKQLRSYLHLDGRPLKSIESVAHAIGTTDASLSSVIGTFRTRDMPFFALMGVNDRSSPAFVLREALPASHLFHLCRGLFEYLYSSTRQSALITGANTEQQKRNRAFAAEFLAPASALRGRITDPTLTWEQAEEIAAEFGVSVYIVRYQLENHHIAQVLDEQDEQECT
jgi:hypothetical protein